MRILWISFYGSWTLPLLYSIKHHNQVGIIIPTLNKQNNYYEQDNISFYELSFKKKELNNNMTQHTFQKYESIIKLFSPDIIHVHGTEKNLAQIQNYVRNIPIVISIQGLLTGYSDYAFNYLDNKKIKKCITLKNKLGKGGYMLMYRNFIHGASYELDILRKGKYFIGRTYWDNAHIIFHNPNALYFHGEELLRDEFYQQSASWNIKNCRQHSIFMPSGFNPIKGMHLAITTVHLLKQYYADIQLSIPGISPNDLNKLTNRLCGEEYIIYCKNLIKEYKLTDNVKFLPRLNAENMVKQLQQAHVFLSPSSIDNSPNAVGEATMIGTPVVTTPVGGVPSILKDEKDVLFAPAGDPYVMAFQIKRIFENNELALSLSRNGHLRALDRHDRLETTSQYLHIYQEIIKIHHK